MWSATRKVAATRIAIGVARSASAQSRERCALGSATVVPPHIVVQEIIEDDLTAQPAARRTYPSARKLLRSEHIVLRNDIAQDLRRHHLRRGAGRPGGGVPHVPPCAKSA